MESQRRDPESFLRRAGHKHSHLQLLGGQTPPGRPDLLKILWDHLASDTKTRGYGVYDKIGAREGVVHLACWAHARREFERALDNDRERAETALSWIQRLDDVERQAREDGLSPDERKERHL